MQKGNYVDGFVLVIPKKNVPAYQKMAREGSKIWKKYGALDYKECMLDDAKPKGVVFPFSKMVSAKPSETVWFSFIVFKSRKHRDEVNAKVMKYFDEKYAKKKDVSMPFDIKRMAYGGFRVKVGA